MPEITSETPRSNITIAGKSFSVPEPYAEGHVLTANEAATLNQTYAENIRNNMASKVASALEAEKAEGDAQKPYDHAAMQTAVDDYVANYEFGIRRGVTGDPVEREALNAARELVKNAIRTKGGKLSDYKPADITARASELLDKYPQIREQAKARVEANQAAAAELASNITVEA
jgi:hypothetical protein